MKNLTRTAMLIMCTLQPLVAMQMPQKKQWTAQEQQHLNDALLYRATYGEVALAKNILANGGQPNIRNEKNWTPLMLAAYAGRPRVCKALLDHGADIDAQSTEGYTALTWALKNGSLEAAVVLIEHGTDPELPDADGNTLLAYSLQNLTDERCKLLLEHGAHLKTKKHHNLLLVATALDSPVIKAEFPWRNLWCNLLIKYSRFHQLHLYPKSNESKQRVWTTLLCWKRLFPNLARDVRKLILMNVPELYQDALNCPMGLFKESVPLIPLSILRTLICTGILNEEQTINTLKRHKFEQLIPLMNEASLLEIDYMPLKPDLLEQNWAADIEGIIKEDLNIHNELLMRKALKKRNMYE